ncbi:hypothetical protein ACFRCI_48515 [Streptomyces sp. NPDC056638]|uniref:hypothetical protein n=1 Tax=Streptomyces sp. NPDC056638 TaxID=3345887 RepID=UPI003676AE6D
MTDPERLGDGVPLRPVHGVDAERGVSCHTVGEAFQGGDGAECGQWFVGGHSGEACLGLVEEGGEVGGHGDGAGLYFGDVGVPVVFRSAGVGQVRAPAVDGFPVERVAGAAAPAA